MIAKKRGKIEVEEIPSTGLSREPEYNSHFINQRFDMTGPPMAENEDHRDFFQNQIAYDEQWSYVGEKMTYPLDRDELRHLELVPDGSDYSKKYHDSEYKNELYTGNLKSTWMPKRVIEPLFRPMPFDHQKKVVLPEKAKERTASSRYYQNTMTPENVGPGLNLGYTGNPQHGFHDAYRVMPKTVDELRPENRPKISYTHPVNQGMKGVNRPVAGKVASYRPPRFSENKVEDILPTSSTQFCPQIHERLIMKEPDRSHQHLEYAGGAYRSDLALDQNMPEGMQSKQKFPTRQNFYLPKPAQKFSNEGMYQNNLKSLPETTRTQMETPPVMGPQSAPRMYINRSDPLPETHKETYLQRGVMPVSSNTLRGVAQDFNLAQSTLREIYSENKLNPHAVLPINQKVYRSDVLPVTTKESYPQPDHMMIGTENGIYASVTDPVSTTLREIYSENKLNPHAVLPINQKVYRSDVLPVTTKESYPQPDHMMIGTENGIYTSVTDPVRTTLRENLHQSVPIISDLPAPKAYSQQPCKTTLRETVPEERSHFVTAGERPTTTLHTPPATTMKENLLTRKNLPEIQAPFSKIPAYLRMPTGTTIGETVLTPSVPRPQESQKMAVHRTDIPAPTLKETLPELSHFAIEGHSAFQVGPSDPLPTTLREIAQNSTTVRPDPEKRGYVIPPRELKPTLREETHSENFQIMGSQRFTVMPPEIPATTMAELTQDLPRSTFIHNPVSKPPVPQDENRRTLKEINAEFSTQPRIQPPQKYQPATIDPPRTTLQETVPNIPYHIIKGEKPKTVQYQTLPTTLGEISIQPTPQGPVSGIGTYTNSPDLPTTLKEATLITQSHPSIQIVPRGKVPLQDISRKTLKETIQQGFRSIISGKKMGKTPLQDNVRTTLKEMVDKTRINQVFQKNGLSAAPMEPSKTSTKELNLETTSPRPTGTSKNKSVNYDPVRTTTAELALDKSPVKRVSVSQKIAVHPDDPAPTTLKEVHLRENAHGNLNRSGVNSYLSQNVFLPETLKETLLVSAGPGMPLGPEKPRPYDDDYRGRINEKSQTINRPPTLSNYQKIPEAENVNLRQRNPVNIDSKPRKCAVFNQNLDRPTIQMNLKNPSREYLIDASILEQLSSNPYYLTPNI